MAKLSKNRKAVIDQVDRAKAYPAVEALTLVKELARAKFTESVDVAVNLGIDPKKSDQVVRGSTVLPNGSGKKVRIAVFAQGANAETAKQAGADVVTIGGLHGTITAIDDATVRLKVASGVELTFNRSAIGSVRESK